VIVIHIDGSAVKPTGFVFPEPRVCSIATYVVIVIVRELNLPHTVTRDLPIQSVPITAKVAS